MRSLVLLLLAPTLAAAYPLPAGDEFQVNQYFTGDQSAPDVATAASGDFVVVWQSPQDGNSGGVVARRYAADGTPSGAEFVVNTSTSGPQYRPAVASDPAGNFVVVWHDQFLNAIVGQRYDAAGTALGGEFTVGAAGSVAHPDVARDAAGNFVVVWKSAVTAIHAQRYDAGGTPQGAVFPVNTTNAPSYDPAVAYDGAGNFVAVWMTDGGPEGILGQRFDGAGTPLGGEFTVTSTAGNMNFISAVAMDASGNFLVAWNVFCCATPTGVLARLYDSTGTPVGPEFEVDNDVGPHGVTPAVGVGDAGGFVVLWAGETPGTGTKAIFARRYDALGLSVGPALQVSSSSGPRSSPATARAASGDFVVVWQGEGQDGNLEGVIARRFAHAAPVKGTRIVLLDSADPTRRKLIFLSNDRNLSTVLGFGVDPAADGAYLHVYNDNGSGESVCVPLPAARWTAAGSVYARRFTYRDPDFLSSPCNRIVVADGRIVRVKCKDIGFSLDEPQQGSIGVSLVSGDARYCAVFGGTITKDAGADDHFKARAAPAPVDCPTPPAACP
jgi:hypothetical protein